MRSSSTPVSPPPPPPVTTRVATLPPLASPERRRRRGSRVRSNVPRVSPSAATTALRRVHRVPHAASGAASAAVDEEEPQKPRRDPRWDRSALDDAALLAALLTEATLLITRVPMTPVSVAISALHPPGASCVRSSRRQGWVFEKSSGSPRCQHFEIFWDTSWVSTCGLPRLATSKSSLLIC